MYICIYKNDNDMNTELRNKIKASNKAVRRLEEAGHVPQGVTRNLKEIAVLVNGKILTFSDYVEAANKILN